MTTSSSLLLFHGDFDSFSSIRNSTHKYNRNANENIHYLMPAEFRSNHVYHATYHNVYGKIPKEAKTISKKLKNGEKNQKTTAKEMNKKILNKHVPTIINAFEFDFVEQKTHQISELFAFRANTKQIKSDIPQSILNLCYNPNLLDFFPMPNQTENQGRTIYVTLKCECYHHHHHHRNR